jgi:ATP-binding cassette, subfamily B, multidrug efflux pump
MLKEFKTLIPMVKKYKYFYFIGFLCLILVDAGELYIPRLMKKVIDYISTEGFLLEFVGKTVGLIIIIALGVAIARFGWRFFITGASRRIESDLRYKLFSHLLTLSSSYFEKTKTGDLMARATNDMRAIRMASGMAFVAFVDATFLTVAILIIIFSEYPKLAAISVIPLPIITLLVLFAGKLIRKYFKAVQEGFSRLTENVQETLSGMRVIKSFAREDFFQNKFLKTNEEYKNSNMRLVRLWGFFFPLINFISGISIMLLFTFGGIAVIEKSITPGDFVALISYLTMLTWPVMGMGFTVNILQRGAASLTRINEILKQEAEIKTTESPSKLISGEDILIKNLNFSYSGSKISKNEEKILQEIDLVIPKGSTLGILGRTGAGKSTFIKLLPRLLDPPAGTVFIGDTDIRDLELSELRSSIGFVPQDTFLFSSTIKENIRFGKPDADDPEVLKMADLSTISKDLNDFPDGWDTEVGERGITLSGGQKQRIAISRAMIMDPSILILDDAFSSVDTATEEKILSSFLVGRKGKTNILVSHRVSTLFHADTIIVIDKGRIIQKGTHRELYETEGFYREIAILQEAEA